MRATFAIAVIARAACAGTRSAASVTPRSESTLALIEARTALDGTAVLAKAGA